MSAERENRPKLVETPSYQHCTMNRSEERQICQALLAKPKAPAVTNKDRQSLQRFGF